MWEGPQRPDNRGTKAASDSVAVMEGRALRALAQSSALRSPKTAKADRRRGLTCMCIVGKCQYVST
jgi:hypothetical protein